MKWILSFSLLLSCATVHAQSPLPFERFDLDTQPEIAALMPPAQNAFGLDVRVFDAGNKPMKVDRAFPGGSGFSFGLRVLAHRGQGWQDRVKLQSVVSSEGVVLERAGADSFNVSQPAPSTPFAGVFWSSPSVNPRSSFLTANVEVAAPGLTDEQNGQRKTPFHIEVPLPVNKEIALDIPFTTQNGTQIRLTKIKNEGNGGVWEGDFVVEKRPRVEALDLQLGTTKIVPQGGQNPGSGFKFGANGQLRNGKGLFGIYGYSSPTSVIWTGELIESSRSWRDESKFKTLSFRVPVAPVVAKTKLAPPTTHRFQVASANGEIDSFELLDDGFQAGFWLSPSSPPTRMERRLELGATYMEGKKEPLFAFAHDSNFWHLDGRPAAPEEQRFEILNREGAFTKPILALSGELEEKPFLQSSNFFRDVPLPAIGQTREFEDGQIETPQFTLRKVAFIENGATFKNAHKVNLEDGPALAFVFQLRRFNTLRAEWGHELRGVFDDRGVAFDERSAFHGEEDFLGGTQLGGEIFVIYLPFDYVPSKTMNLSLDWSEFGASKTTPFSVELPVATK